METEVSNIFSKYSQQLAFTIALFFLNSVVTYSSPYP